MRGRLLMNRLEEERKEREKGGKGGEEIEQLPTIEKWRNEWEVKGTGGY